MSSIDNLRTVRPPDTALPSPVSRGQGIIASLISYLVARATTRRLMRELNPRMSYRAQDIPDTLREDLGLPPLPPRPTAPWEVRW